MHSDDPFLLSHRDDIVVFFFLQKNGSASVYQDTKMISKEAYNSAGKLDIFMI